MGWLIKFESNLGQNHLKFGEKTKMKEKKKKRRRGEEEEEEYIDFQYVLRTSHIIIT